MRERERERMISINVLTQHFEKEKNVSRLTDWLNITFTVLTGSKLSLSKRIDRQLSNFAKFGSVIPYFHLNNSSSNLKNIFAMYLEKKLLNSNVS